MRALNVKTGVTAANGLVTDNGHNLHEERLSAYKRMRMFRLPATHSCQRCCLRSTGFPLLREACHFCCGAPNNGNIPVNRSGHFSAAHVYVTTCDCSAHRNLGRLHSISVRMWKCMYANMRTKWLRKRSLTPILTFWSRNYFFNFSTHCI